MKNIKNKKMNKSQSKKTLMMVVMATFIFTLVGMQSAYAAISRELDIGDSGSDVTELQTYLANSSTYYPSGLVTGYYGQLTKAAVERFQTSQGIVHQGTPETTGYGRVGPQTMASINSMLGGAVGNQTSWHATPNLSNLVVQHTNTTATISWTTNEATQGQVYWNNYPLQLNEATGPRQQPYVSGNVIVDNGGMQAYHNVAISNLQPNTTYYYLVRGVDSVGNMSMIWPSTFRTSQ